MNALTRTLTLTLTGAFLTAGLLAQNPDGSPVQPGDVEAPADARKAAPIQTATLAQVADDEMIQLTVGRTLDPGDTFLGVILVSFESKAVPTYADLPPLLAKHAVLAAGFGRMGFDYMLKRSRLPADIEVFTQGVVFEWSGITTTGVARLGGGIDG